MTATSTQTILAFDGLAERYDALFTNTPIGRAQRRAVWNAVREVFKPGDRVLELNCGTGEDALYLARLGVDVVACDASPGMIAMAQRRHAAEKPEKPIAFYAIATENISQLDIHEAFDGVFSNFSGLNCVGDIKRVAADLAALTKPGARLLFCLSSRICAWEVIWFLSRLQFRSAVRRFAGNAVVQVEGHPVQVWYPTVRHIRSAFAPLFTLRGVRAVGLFVPPSYASSVLEGSPRLLRMAEATDRAVGGIPVLRGLGDHVLLDFERSAA